MNCDVCGKEYERNTFCSGACKVEFHNHPKKYGVSKSKKILAKKVEPLAKPKLLKALEEILPPPFTNEEVMETVANLEGRKYKNGCPKHGKMECSFCHYRNGKIIIKK